MVGRKPYKNVCVWTCLVHRKNTCVWTWSAEDRMKTSATWTPLEDASTVASLALTMVAAAAAPQQQANHRLPVRLQAHHTHGLRMRIFPAQRNSQNTHVLKGAPVNQVANHMLLYMFLQQPMSENIILFPNSSLRCRVLIVVKKRVLQWSLGGPAGCRRNFPPEGRIGVSREECPHWGRFLLTGAVVEKSTTAPVHENVVRFGDVLRKFNVCHTSVPLWSCWGALLG